MSTNLGDPTISRGGFLLCKVRNTPHDNDYTLNQDLGLTTTPKQGIGQTGVLTMARVHSPNMEPRSKWLVSF